MYEATFELEAITPLFMRGADQRKAEFRSASVKGVMRWWFRALAGNYFGNKVEELRKAECRVFGCAGQETRRSAVVVEVNAERPQKIRIENFGIKLNPKKQKLVPKSNFQVVLKKKDGELVPFLGYLWFSVKMFIEDVLKDTVDEILWENKIRNHFTNWAQVNNVLRNKGMSVQRLNTLVLKRFEEHNAVYYYPPGSRFTVTLSSPDKRAFDASIASLWVAVTLGGFGFRARRGAGSMMFTRADILDEMDLPDIPFAPDDIGQGIVRAVELVAGPHGTSRPVSGIFSYPTLTPGASAVAVWEGKEESPLKALKAFQKAYQDFRKQGSLRSRRVTLGLPIVRGNLGRELGPAAKKARRASPLVVSVTPLGTGWYTLVFTKFLTEPFYRVLESKNKWIEEKITRASDWEVLYQFDRNFERHSMYPETIVYGSLEVFQ